MLFALGFALDFYATWAVTNVYMIKKTTTELLLQACGFAAKDKKITMLYKYN